MKAEITKKGKILITAETPTEAWAIDAIARFYDSDKLSPSFIALDCSVLVGPGVDNKKPGDKDG